MTLLLAALLLSAKPDPAAIALAHRATSEYNAGEFGQAFLDYQAAYDLAPIPDLLFDMAQCQKGLHHWERAAFLYKRYLATKPHARNRAKVEDLLAAAELKAKEEQPAAETAPAPAPQAAPAPTEAAPQAPATPEKPVEVPPAKAAEAPAPTAEAAVPPPADEGKDRLNLVPPPQEVTEPPPPAHHGLPALTWITGATGAACLVGAGTLLGIVLVGGHEDNPITQNGVTTHSLTYSSLQLLNTEGSISLGLAIGGVVLLGASAIIAVASQ